jgi:hypothetical protein
MPARLRHGVAIVVLLLAGPLGVSGEETPSVLWSYSQFATFETPGDAEAGEAALREVHSAGQWTMVLDQPPGLTAEQCSGLIRPAADGLARSLREQDPGVAIAPQADGLDTVTSKEKRTIIGLYRYRCFPAGVTPAAAPTEIRAENLKPARPAVAGAAPGVAAAPARTPAATPKDPEADRQLEFRRDLEDLLGRLERAMGYLGNSLAFEEFEVRVSGFGREVEAFRRKHGAFMDRDDDARWLAHPVLKACGAFLRAERTWGRQVAEREHLAFLQSELKGATAVHSDFPGLDRASVRQHELNIAASRTQLREVEQERPADLQTARELFKRATEAVRTGTGESSQKSGQ